MLLRLSLDVEVTLPNTTAAGEDLSRFLYKDFHKNSDCHEPTDSYGCPVQGQLKEWLWNEKKHDILSAMKVTAMPLSEKTTTAPTSTGTAPTTATALTAMTNHLDTEKDCYGNDGITTVTTSNLSSGSSCSSSSNGDVADGGAAVAVAVADIVDDCYQHKYEYDDIQDGKDRRIKSSQDRLMLLDVISQVQRQYLQREEAKVVFGGLLDALLELMDSEYGFIGEVKYEEDDNTMYLQTHAITNIAWNDETRKFYEQNIQQGLKFYNLNSLFGTVMTTKEPVISNTPKTDSRGCGVPKGHPPLNHFLGIPFFEQGSNEIVGMVGIANKPGGYTNEDIDFLEPFLMTCCNLIQAYGAVQENKRLINSLEERVAERTSALLRANADLEEANRKVKKAAAAQLTHFACMSHELRTPLNCIVGLSSVLNETSLNAMQKESLRMIISSGQLLCTIVNDILDFSKLESGNVDITIQKTNLQDTLNSVVQSIDNKARKNKLEFRTYYRNSVPNFIETDCVRLQQILFNLLGNAIKFSKEGGTVELSVELLPGKSKGKSYSDGDITDTSRKSDGSSCTDPRMSSTESKSWQIEDETCTKVPEISRCPFHRHSGNGGDFATQPMNQEGTTRGPKNRCPFGSKAKAKRTQSVESISSATYEGAVMRFTVKDYGRGIEKEYFGKIFEPFAQANSDTERLYGGTGLGLAITAKLVERLGGTINVNSEFGKWSEFIVELPVGRPVDCLRSLSTRLEKTHVLYMPGDSQGFDYKMFDYFNVSYTIAETVEDTSKWLSTLEAASRESLPQFIFFLVPEEMYDQATYRRISRLVPSALVTFGPNHSVLDSQLHIRSLSHHIPCVLMEDLLSLKENENAPTPKSPRSRRQSLITKIEGASLGNLAVLIAEDNLVNQKVLRHVLSRLGVHNVDIVENGLEAVNLSSTKKFDIIFMDLQMPLMDGLEATRIIVNRRDKEQKLVPKIVFLTAHVSQSYELEALAAGADGFISKPFDLKKIRAYLREMTDCPELESP